MNQRKFTIMMRLLSSALALLIPLMFIACGDDDDGPGPLPIRPSITFDGGANATVERGSSIEIDLTLTAPGGIQSLTVNGDDLAFTTANAEGTEGTASYPFEAASDEPVGEQVIEFVITDNRDQETQVDFTVTVVGLQVELSEDITEDLTLDPDNSYTVTDTVDVTGGATLTIPAGTVIRFQVFDEDPGNELSFVQAGGIEIDSDGSLVVEGTAAAPVVMTTDGVQNGGEPGTWIGLRIRENEGMRPAPIDINYLRVEYAGSFREFDGSNPVYNSAIRLDSLGTDANIEYVQVFGSQGIGFEIRGGEYNMKHVVVTSGFSNGFVFRDDYDANVQFLIVNNPEGDHGDREIRVRNGASVTFSNVTGVGSGAGFIPPGESELGTLDFARINDNAGGVGFYNTVAAEYPEDGIRGQRYIAGQDTIAHSFIFRIGGVDDDGIIPPGETEGTTALRDLWALEFADVPTLEIDPDNTLIPGIGVDDYVPDAAETVSFDPSTLDPFFDAANYAGAVGSMDWTLGWTRNGDGSLRE